MNRLTRREIEALDKVLVPFIEWPTHWTYATGTAHDHQFLKNLAQRGLIELYMPDQFEYRLTAAGREALEER